ncbi:hypothetical protein [Denitrobaculum tricleocarpae]|uniref:Uncharacterized protein n=1 Tax=Denitrobaculum tricleocarpae TaxID=2591009 RepID=A0A545TGI2_9PROT|nr:hypothetical protein [Denitrobaculum tricleocarpae]TQV76342.1 hypothetical protein FKG95_22190 [Denitrobaculum tricleocarpae]
MYGDWWIDDMGKWRAAELPGAMAESAIPIGSDIREQQTAYRQLGLVKALLTPTTVTFRWDVWYASPEAIESMIDFLEIDKQPRRIVLDFFYGGWITETFYAPGAAIKRIREADLYRSVELIDTIFIKEQGMDSIDRSSDLIKRGYEYLTRSKCFFESKDDTTFVSLYRKSLMYTASDMEDVFLRLHVGMDSAFARASNAQQLDDVLFQSRFAGRPSDRYGKTVSAAYTGVLHSGEPRLHHVRALFRREGSEPIWAPYQRLLFPSTLSDGTPVVVCLSDITQDVSIPFLRPNADQAEYASGQ